MVNVLLPQHQAMLTASAVDPEVAAERGYRSVTVKAELKRLGFADYQCSVPTLLVPIHAVHGGIGLYHHRPDAPRIGKNGKPNKYEFPKGAAMAVDVHPRMKPLVRDPSVPLVITEGVKKADAAISAGLCCIDIIGTWNWRGTNEFGGKTALPDWEGIALKDARDRPRQVYICFDSDVMLKPQVHAALARLAAFLKQRGATVAFLYLPHGEYGAKVGLDDYLAAGHSSDELLALASTELRPLDREQTGSDDELFGNEADGKGGRSSAAELITLAAGVEFFRTERQENYARFSVGAHRQTWPVRSSAFKQWLAREHHRAFGKPVGSQALEDALRVLESKARYDGPEHRLGVRCMRESKTPGSPIWIDMADVSWRAVKVTEGSWEITGSSADYPPLFRRHVTQSAMAEPIREARLTDIEGLRPFLNVKTEALWKLLVAWLVAAWVPEIAHPVLVAHGEQGTAKSTLIHLLSRLVDPSVAAARCEPSNKDEWIQAADHTWMVSLDNVSSLPGWLSDALCRAVTGEAFVKRQLFTDSDDIVMAFRRVVALTGIEVVAQRADLLDRSILLALEPIPKEKRRPESDVLAEFEIALPRLTGALLSLLSAVLAALPSVTLARMPRMADFARVGVAVERVLGWPDGSFLLAYEQGIDDQNEEAISGTVIGEPLMKFLDQQCGNEGEPSPCATWTGTMNDLLKALCQVAGEKETIRREWPKNAKALSGQIRRIAPNLRAAGIDMVFGRSGKQRVMKMTRANQMPERNEDCDASAWDVMQEEALVTQDFGENDAFHEGNGAGDANDATFPPPSNDSYGCRDFGSLSGNDDEDAYLEAIRR